MCMRAEYEIQSWMNFFIQQTFRNKEKKNLISKVKGSVPPKEKEHLVIVLQRV